MVAAESVVWDRLDAAASTNAGPTAPAALDRLG
jgi:hypothetical protein